MFHWICPECGREIPPAVKECPACDPKAALLEVAPKAADKVSLVEQRVEPAAPKTPPVQPPVQPIVQPPVQPIVQEVPVAVTPPPLPVETAPALPDPDPLLALAEQIRSAHIRHANPVVEPPREEPKPVFAAPPQPEVAPAAGLAELAAVLGTEKQPPAEPAVETPSEPEVPWSIRTATPVVPQQLALSQGTQAVALLAPPEPLVAAPAGQQVVQPVAAPVAQAVEAPPVAEPLAVAVETPVEAPAAQAVAIPAPQVETQPVEVKPQPVPMEQTPEKIVAAEPPPIPAVLEVPAPQPPAVQAVPQEVQPVAQAVATKTPEPVKADAPAPQVEVQPVALPEQAQAPAGPANLETSLSGLDKPLPAMPATEAQAPPTPPLDELHPPLLKELAAVQELVPADNPPSGSRLQLAPLQDYATTISGVVRPAAPPTQILSPDSGPRITLPGPTLPPDLVNLKSPGVVTVIGEQPAKRRLPGWLISALLMLGIPIAGGLLLMYFQPVQHSSADAPPPAPEIQTPATPPPAAEGAHSLAQFVEVTGFRIVVDFNKKSEIHYLVVNHSSADLSDMTLYVTLRNANAKPGQPPVARFSFRAPGLGPFESKEMSSPIEKLTKSVSLPDWQDLRSEVQIAK